MTIYYSLTFLLLAAEMVTFCVLVSPMPFKVKKQLFKFLSESYIIAKVAYALKISFIFITILFVDALQRMFRVTADSELSNSPSPETGGRPVSDIRTETNLAARKFYSQRNVYLTGFTLFLSLVLTRTFYIILDLIHVQEEYGKLKEAQEGGANGKAEAVDVETLRKELEEERKKSRDFETLKKQAAQQAAELDRLSTKYNEATGNVSDKRKD